MLCLSAGCQRAIGSLAGLSYDPGGASIFSQDSRAPVSPAEHVGKHSDGIAGCMATVDSGGLAGKLGDTGAQLVSSSASIGARGFSFLRCSIGNLRLIPPK